jgi:hypothetical protein
LATIAAFLLSKRVWISGRLGLSAKLGHGAQLEQLTLRDGQRAADGRVVGVASGVERDQGVVGVVAAEEEYTDQRLVIGGALR